MPLHPQSSLLSEADRERLNKMVNDPLLSAAVNIAIREAQPRAHVLAKLDAVQQASIANQLAGMSELVRRLQLLSSPLAELTPRDNPSDLGAWTHLDTEEPT